MVTVLEKTIKKVDEKNNPKKILISYNSWNTMLKEEELTSGFCTKHKAFLGHDNMWCAKCKSKEFSVTRELPIITILNLPYEMSSNVEDIKII